MKKLLILIGAVVLLAGMFYLLKPKPAPAPSQPPATAEQAPPPPSPQPKQFELVVKNRQLVSGAANISVTQGDEVVIKVMADEAEEFHIHGYDQSVDLEKDKPAELKFTATLTGNFPFELEHSKTDLGALQVQPK